MALKRMPAPWTSVSIGTRVKWAFAETFGNCRRRE
jgi:hypothetical protein